MKVWMVVSTILSKWIIDLATSKNQHFSEPVLATMRFPWITFVFRRSPHGKRKSLLEVPLLTMDQLLHTGPRQATTPGLVPCSARSTANLEW